MIQLQNDSVTERLTREANEGIEWRRQTLAMLGRLAHLVSRHRWKVIAVWIVLTLFGAFAAGQVSQALVPELLDPGQVRLRGEPADAEGVRHRRPAAGRRRLPHGRRRDEERGDRGGDGARGRGGPRRPDELVLLDARPDVRLEGPAHDLRGGLSARAVDRSRRRAGRPKIRAAAAPRAAGRDPGQGHGPRPARGSEHARRADRERPRRGADRRPRRAGDPALRLRDAARGPDADRRRGRGDPQHVHARLGADLHHERVDHRRSS